MNTQRKYLLSFILLRLIIVTSLLISAVIIQFSTSIFLPLDPFYYLILTFYLFSLVYFIFYLWNKSYNLQVYFQILVDILLITALVYISGGLKGSFYFLYIFDIIAASIILSSRTAFLTAALSAIFFGFLVEGMYFRIIPFFNNEQQIELSLGVVTNNIFISWGVFFLVALLMNFLNRNLRKTREQLRLAQKELEIKNRLALVGEVSAQLAHEIRNPLTAIAGSIQLLNEELPLNEEQKELMKIVIKESKRVSKSIEQFLNVTFKEKVEYSDIDLGALVKETITLLEKGGELNGMHRIVGNFRSNKVKYWGQAEHFKQIFWNLIKNSIKAMPSGGTLAIEINQKNGNQLQFKFTDTGRGMTEEEKSRVFEPFYSGFKNGIGVGMSVVRRIIENYQGSLQLFSKPKKGTEIVITLPINENKNRAKKEEERV
ncbi:MAG: nitrogen regulation protein NR(II) [Candidatus Aminicenantales bacterium]